MGTRYWQVGSLRWMGACLTAAVLTLSSCSDVRRTSPDRAANEQLLISKAADKAVAQLDFGLVPGQSVLVDGSKFESYDKGYVLSQIRTEVLEQGGRLMDKRENADVIVEVSSGALSINRKSQMIGMPEFEAPVPFSDSIEVPEVALFSSLDRTGFAKLAAAVYDRESGEIIQSVGPVYGLSWLNNKSIVGYGWRQDNVLPEDIPTDPPSS